MKLGIAMLIHNKDDIEFVTEFSYLFIYGTYIGDTKMVKKTYTL